MERQPTESTDDDKVLYDVQRRPESGSVETVGTKRRMRRQGKGGRERRLVEEQGGGTAPEKDCPEIAGHGKVRESRFTEWHPRVA